MQAGGERERLGSKVLEGGGKVMVGSRLECCMVECGGESGGRVMLEITDGGREGG